MTAPCPDRDCPGCREWHAIHTRLCPEVPRDVREEQRKRDREIQRRLEDAAAGWGRAPSSGVA